MRRAANSPPVPSEAIHQVLDSFPEPVRARVLDVRALIYELAEETPAVHSLTETLKWGQISYLNPAGTTLRISTLKAAPTTVGLFVHCQTSIVDELRERYPEAKFDGTRCLRLSDGLEWENAVTRVFIVRALTYKVGDVPAVSPSLVSGS